MFRNQMFTPSSVCFVVPSEMYPTFVVDLERHLLGEGPRSLVNLHSNILTHSDVDMKRFSVQSVGHPTRTRFAIGTGILVAQKPYSLADWSSKILRPTRKPGEHEDAYESRCAERKEKSKGELPQIFFYPDADAVEAVEGVKPPYISDARHFDLTAAQQTRFEQLVKAANGSMHLYRAFVDEQRRSEDDKQQWIADLVWDMIHEWAPNLAGFIGAQYAQSTCVKLQDDVYRDDVNPAGIGKPRAYWPADEEYKNDVSPGVRRLGAGFIDSTGIALFSEETFMCGFAGVPGGGKSTVQNYLQLMVGSAYVMRLDSKHNNYSMSMYGDTFLFVTQDQSSKSVAITADIRDNVLGAKRNEPTGVNVQVKYKNEAKKSVHAVSAVTCRNAAPEEVIADAALSPIEKLLSSCLGTEGGDCRRVTAPAPFMVQLNLGTANPTDHLGNYAFDASMIKQKDFSDIPFMIVIMWMTTTLAETTRDPMFGLVGSESSDEFDALLTMYLDMGKDTTAAKLEILTEVDTSPAISVRNHKAPSMTSPVQLTMTPSIPYTVLKQRYYANNGSQKLKQMPAHYPPLEKAPHCRYCGICFYGSRTTRLRETALAIAADPALTDQAKHSLVRFCPVSSAKRCIDNITVANVLPGFMFRVALT
jgi:hypothetical protein